ncbi:hypothetical protein WJX73_006926 [Symbiochloris irregularis]|uniref:2-amino-4-hydroxy-6-hydroxymethyldihydropteridine diphosphokinase n=1 Tax=Symbiochloris irregularis TaxID=706552 RepID=A0AAW1NQ20_9CHLO
MAAHEAVIAIGGNTGNRLANLRQGLQLLVDHGIEVLRKSRLYETAPELVTDQPAFLNAAVAVKTELAPHELLHSLKDFEAALGRQAGGQRYGPRPLDLDIIFHDHSRLDDEALTIPHARWQERAFVLAPVNDLYTPQEFGQEGIGPDLQAAHKLWQQWGGESLVGKPGLQAVLPLGGADGRLWPWRERTQVMAVLNLTPDSFSDGGQISTLGEAVLAARQAVAQGADIIDIGGQSTRPNAARLDAATECSRIIPAIRAMASDAQLRNAVLSVDTFQAESPANTTYQDICADVGTELQAAADKAMAAGIEPWSLILDPGIGFAKTLEGNASLIVGLQRVRGQLQGCLQGMPLMMGTSRKGFLGKITGRKDPTERDTATAATLGLADQV